MDKAVLDHRGPEFQKLGLRVLSGIKTIFKTKSHVFLFPASGTGAWEAALVNAFSPGDKILMFETGHFATLWKTMATKLGLQPGIHRVRLAQRAPTRPPSKPACARTRSTRSRPSASSTTRPRPASPRTSPTSGRRSTPRAIRRCSWSTRVSGLASADFRMDEWGVDVTVSGSQKGLMLPPGIGLTGVSEKAMKAAKDSKIAQIVLLLGGHGRRPTSSGFFPYTPATNLLWGLAEAIDMLHEEGLDRVFARHIRHGEATRRAVRAWGLEILCKDPKAYSPVLTAILMPQGHDSDEFRKIALEHFDISLGAGLVKIAGKVFRIGHLGDTNDLTILGALSGVEMSARHHGRAL